MKKKEISKKEDLIQAVVDSISTEAQLDAAEIVEAGIDTFISEGFLKKIMNQPNLEKTF